MVKNPNGLLDKGIIKTLFLKYRRELNLTDNIEIIEIQRFLALAPETYILMYTVADSGKFKYFRGNSSTKDSRINGYDVMRILARSGFNEGKYRLPERFVYDSDYNLLLYENIHGEMLIDVLNDSLDNLKLKIEYCGQWLAKLHSIDSSVQLKGYDWSINTKLLEAHYPDLAKQIPVIVKETLKQVNSKEKILIHGDYQPNNIILNQEKIWVFDYNDSASDNPLIDISTFLTQLRVMLLRFGNIEHYDPLRTVFISAYQQTRALQSIHHQDINLYSRIFYLKILVALAAVIDDSESTKREILEKVYKFFKEADNPWA